MSLPEHLLAAVVADPRSDEPRLACAAWLEENGDPERASYIRLQCQASRLPAPSRERSQLVSESARIYRRNRDSFVGHPRQRNINWTFNRGFPHWVRIRSFKVLAAHRQFLFPPTLQRLWIWRLRAVSQLAACPELQRVPQLDLSGSNLGDARLQRLVSSPFLGKLTWLNLGRNSITAAGVEFLTRSMVPGLTSLGFGGGGLRANRFGPEGARVLAGWPGLKKLRALDLSDTALGDAGSRILLRSAHWPALVSLSLRRCDLTPPIVDEFARTRCWANLRRLDLSGNRLGDAVVRLIARCRRLRRLSLVSCQLTDDGVAALLETGVCSRLTELDLTGNAITDAGARLLARSPHLGRLERLRLTRNPIGDEGGWELGQSTTLSSLRHLSAQVTAMSRRMATVVELRFRQGKEPINELPPLPAPPPIPELPPIPWDGHAEEGGLWQAIVDDPDDDTARLVYADWLEDHNQAQRAALIREQLARGHHNALLPVQVDLGPLAPHAVAVMADRGMVQVALNPTTLTDQQLGPQVLSWVRQYRVSGLELSSCDRNQIPALLPLVAVCHELSLPPLVFSGLGRAVSPNYANVFPLLHTLRLSKGFASVIYFRQFFQNQGMPRLRRLFFDRCTLTTELFHQITALPHAPRLTTLTLTEGRVAAPALAVLCNSPNLTGLIRLDVASNRLALLGTHALSLSTGLPRLRHLGLANNGIEAEAIPALCRWPRLLQLYTLDLSLNPLDDGAVQELAETLQQGELRTLTLSEKGISPFVRRELTERLGAALVWKPGGCDGS